MLYQLPNGKTIEISIDQYLKMSDEVMDSAPDLIQNILDVYKENGFEPQFETKKVYTKIGDVTFPVNFFDDGKVIVNYPETEPHLNQEGIILREHLTNKFVGLKIKPNEPKGRSTNS